MASITKTTITVLPKIDEHNFIKSILWKDCISQNYIRVMLDITNNQNSVYIPITTKNNGL